MRHNSIQHHLFVHACHKNSLQTNNFCILNIQKILARVHIDAVNCSHLQAQVNSNFKAKNTNLVLFYPNEGYASKKKGICINITFNAAKLQTAEHKIKQHP